MTLQRKSIVLLLAFAVSPGFAPYELGAAETATTNQSGSGSFVSFYDGTLVIRGKSGLMIYDNVGDNYQTYQNNEEGPGSRLVGTVHALSGAKLPGRITPLAQVMPGTVVHVNVEAREISFGFDYRVIGTFVSYQEGKLDLLAADVPPGFVKKPSGKISLTIDRAIPALESIDGDYLKFAGSAEEALKSVRTGALITARSHYDPDAIEVVEIGEPKHRMERYIGQSRGPARGTLVSFKDGILRIRGKALGPLAVSDYDRLIARRLSDTIPIFESIDGGAYQPTTLDALRTAKEGTIITIRKVEDVLLDIQIGVPRNP